MAARPAKPNTRLAEGQGRRLCPGAAKGKTL